ncbi:MAG: TRAP transporter small permease subunit [Alphaproteobacteria bacterium]|nr:TRAP transporter small permease subunit [Alphaproteobacteria bacterium]
MLMVLVQFTVVLLRYIFGYNSIFMQESIFYMHALLFILGAGFTLYQDGHVRVDIFYQSASEKYKACVDLFGVFALLLPFCIMLIVVTIPYVAQSWAVLEGSKETSGIPAVYLLKSSIFAFCGFLILQGIAIVASSILTLMGRSVHER